MLYLLPHSLALLACASLVTAHGSHENSPNINPDDDWAAYHMAEEHHIDNFDPTSFFTMHDFNGDGVWDATEVRRLYGMDDESNKDEPQSKKDSAVERVFDMFDLEDTGQITKNAFLTLTQKGTKLPNFHLGPGHHGDIEYEYEIHHFEKFHDENTKEEDLTHPEDIAHFRLHDQLEDEAERTEKLEGMKIVEQNIPMKFRKQG